MKIARECIPCLARQATEIAVKSTDDKLVQEEIIIKCLEELSKLDFELSAPEIGRLMHLHAMNITGNFNPYQKLKDEYNEIALDITDIIKREQWIEDANDPFDLACRLSIAGNIIDFSVGLNLDYSKILASVSDSLESPLFGDGPKVLEESIANAKNIMFIADNAGEIIFDKFLLEQLPTDKVTYVVKGGPIVNDATIDDVHFAGIDKMVKVIDNGVAAQGTILNECSEEFLKAYCNADVVISKGQANYETLSDENKNIFFLLRAKCESVAKSFGCNKMDYVLTLSKKLTM